jgi:hypothetical protein
MAEKQQQQREDSIGSDAFDHEYMYGDDPDDFVANAKPSGSASGKQGANSKNKQGGIYSSKHTRIKQAQRETRQSAKPPPKT